MKNPFTVSARHAGLQPPTRPESRRYRTNRTKGSKDSESDKIFNLECYRPLVRLVRLTPPPPATR